MRKMTQEALKKLDNLLGFMQRSDWWTLDADDVECDSYDFSKHDIAIVRHTLRKLPVVEECLARGGMVRDAGGRWCSHGDRVRFKRGRNADDSSEECSRGELFYSVDDGMWYINTEDGDWFRLGSTWEEVSAWEYEAVQGGKQ